MPLALTELSAGSARDRASIRVMVVDDAVVVRAMITRWVEAELDMQIVASLRGAPEAIEQIERKKPDVVILDVTMPDMDGITALPLLLQKKRDLVVLMVSTLTRRNAEISLHALSLGAADYVPKPEGDRELMSSDSFRRELIDKIRVLGSRRKHGHSERRTAPVTDGNGTQRELTALDGESCIDEACIDVPGMAVAAADAGNVVLRPFPS